MRQHANTKCIVCMYTDVHLHVYLYLYSRMHAYIYDTSKRMYIYPYIYVHREVAVCGCIGPVTSGSMPTSSVSDDEIGVGMTARWRLGCITPSTTLSFFFKPMVCLDVSMYVCVRVCIKCVYIFVCDRELSVLIRGY